MLLRLIGKWLNAGILEGLVLSYPDEGTPQGGVISPLLANIYLHAVLDDWFVRDVQPALVRSATMVRYADDCAPRRRGKETAGSNGSSLAVREVRAGPSGSGLQDLGSNHRMLLWSNDRGGERDGKGGTNPSGVRCEDERK